MEVTFSHINSAFFELISIAGGFVGWNVAYVSCILNYFILNDTRWRICSIIRLWRERNDSDGIGTLFVIKNWPDVTSSTFRRTLNSKKKNVFFCFTWTSRYVSIPYRNLDRKEQEETRLAGGATSEDTRVYSLSFRWPDEQKRRDTQMEYANHGRSYIMCMCAQFWGIYATERE